jgi:hypothetical protein
VNRDFFIAVEPFLWKKVHFSALRIFGGITGVASQKKVAVPVGRGREMIETIRQGLNYGLRQEFITPHNPQQSGMVERVIRTLKEQCVHRNRFERSTACPPCHQRLEAMDRVLRFKELAHWPSARLSLSAPHAQNFG